MSLSSRDDNIFRLLLPDVELPSVVKICVIK